MVEIRFLKKKSLFTKNIEKKVFFQKKKVDPPIGGGGVDSLTLNFGKCQRYNLGIYIHDTIN